MTRLHVVVAAFVALCGIVLTPALALPPSHDAQVIVIYHDWYSPELVSTTICLDHAGNDIKFSNLRLTLSNDLGVYRVVEGASQKTDQQLCFAGVTMTEKELHKTLQVRVEFVGHFSRKQTLVEAEVYQIVPQVSQPDEHTARVTWLKPGPLHVRTRTHGDHTTTMPCTQCSLDVVVGEVVVLEVDGETSIKQVLTVHTRAATPTITEIRKVMRESDPSGKNHNLKVVFSEPINQTNVGKWELVIQGGEGGTVVYVTDVEDSAPDTVQELVFEGNYRAGNFFYVSGKDESGESLSPGCISGSGVLVTSCNFYAFFADKVPDIDARVARLAGPPKGSGISLLVHVGTVLEAVEVGDQTCTRDDGVCYYLEVNLPLPLSIPRRLDNVTTGGQTVSFYDDTITVYQKLEEDPTLVLRDQTVLELRDMDFSLDIKVVLYSPEGSHEMLMPIDDSCHTTDGAGDVCERDVEIPEGMTLMNVLVIVVDAEAFVQHSSLIPFEVYTITAHQLTANALELEWEPLTSGDYTLTIETHPTAEEPYSTDILAKATYSCDVASRGGSCQGYFLRLDLPDFYRAAVRRVDSKNKVASVISSSGIAPQSNVTRISQVHDSVTATTKTSVTVTAADAIVTSSRFIVLIDNDAGDVVNETHFDGLATQVSGGFVFDFDQSLELYKDDLNVFVLGLSDEGVVNVGSAYVSLKEFAVEMTWVGGNGRDDPLSSLRLVTDSSDTVYVEESPCSPDVSPCYVVDYMTSQDLVAVCRRVDNDLPGDQPILEQCEEQVPAPHQDMTDFPALVLRDKTSLEVTLDGMSGAEVVMYDPAHDHIFSTPDDYACTSDGGDGTCSQEVDIGAGVRDVMVLLVLLDADGKVVQSSLYPFEVYRLSTQQLTGQVVLVSWLGSTEGTYIVQVISEDDEIVAETTCDEESGDPSERCQVYLFGLPSTTRYTVTLGKKDDTNVVADSFVSGVPPPQGTFASLTRVHVKGDPAPSVTTKLTVTPSSPVTSANSSGLVIHVTNLGVEKELYIDGNAEALEDGSWEFEFEWDLKDVLGPLEVLAIGYNDDEEPVFVVPANFTLVDIPVQMWWVGGNPGNPTSSLRLATTSTEALDVDGNSCSAATSPCYLVGYTTPLPHVAACLGVFDAVSGRKIEQCEEEEPLPFIDLSSPAKLMLLDDTQLEVTSTFALSTSAAEVLVYLQGDSTATALACDFDGAVKEEERTCTSTISTPESYGIVQVLVVGLDGGQEVVESTVVELEDVKVVVQSVAGDAVEVRWTILHDNPYTATLLSTIPAPTTRTNPAGALQQVSCNRDEGGCEVHFVRLEGAEYSVMVARDGHDTSTSVVTFVVDSGDLPKSAQLTKLSRISANHTAVTAVGDEALTDAKVTLAVLWGSSVVRSQVTLEGTMTSKEPPTFMFEHDGPILEAGDADFLLLGRGEDGTVTDAGLAYLTLQDLDARVTWLGDGSLRVDTGSLAAITVGPRKCASDASPCYYLEDDTLPDVVERCGPRANGAVGQPTVDQCEEEIDVATAMDGSATFLLQDNRNLEVSATYLPSTVAVEVVVYRDPSAAPDEVPCPLGTPGDPCVAEVVLPDVAGYVTVLLVGLDSAKNEIEYSYTTMEDVRVEVEQLTGDVVEVRWSTFTPGPYTAIVETPKDVVQQITCTEPKPTGGCSAHFARLDGYESDFEVKVHRDGQDTSRASVGFALEPSGFPLAEIVKVSKLSFLKTRVTMSEVNTAGVTKATLVMLTGDQIRSEVSSESHEMIESPVSFKFNHTSVPDVGEVDYILQLRGEDGTVLAVAEAYLDLIDLDADVAWVGAGYGEPRSSLRVHTGSLEELVVGTYTCWMEDSPCYYLEDPQVPQVVERCSLANDTSPGGTQVQQCDGQVTEFTELDGLSSVVLTDSKILSVSAAFSDATDHVEITVYNRLMDTLASATVECSLEASPSTCEMEVDLPSVAESLEVLLVGVDAYLATMESRVMQLEALDVQVVQLTPDAIEVRWTALSDRPYVAVLQTPEALASRSSHAALNNPEALASSTPTVSPVCSDDGPCRVHFVNLEDTTAYSVVVRALDDTSSQVSTTVALDTTELPPSSSITKVSRISTSQTQITLEADDTYGETNVTLSVQWGSDLKSEVILEGELVLEAPVTFEFLEVVLMEGKRELFVVAREEENVLGVASAYLDLPAMDTRLAWVGADYAPSGNSYLRVATGSLPEVEVSGMESCTSVASPCYYLNATLPQDVPRCQSATNSQPGGPAEVEQCDHVIKVFVGVSGDPVIRLTEDELLTLEVSFVESPHHVEVVAFDPFNATIVFSPPKYECEATGVGGEGATNEGAWMCKQHLNGSRALDVVEVLVVGVAADGEVLGSVFVSTTVIRPKEVNVGAIVGGVVGALAGVGVVVVVIVMQRRRRRRSEGCKSSDTVEVGVEMGEHDESPVVSVSPVEPIISDEPESPTSPDDGAAGGVDNPNPVVDDSGDEDDTELLTEL